MYFENFSSLLNMGGYALYVWLSFGTAALSIAVLWGDSFLSKQRLFTQVLSEQARQTRIKAANEQSSNGEPL